MPQIANFDEEAKQYFYSLPKFVQESILQSGVPLYSKDDLVRFQANLNSQQ